jgi:hypothetical protein
MTEITLTAEIDYSEIAKEIDYSDLANEIDVDDVANEIDLDDVAAHVQIDYSDLAGEIDYDDLYANIDIDGAVQRYMEENDAPNDDLVSEIAALKAELATIKTGLSGLAAFFTMIRPEGPATF